MARISEIAFVLLLVAVSVRTPAQSTQPATAPSAKGWEIVDGTAFAVAVPGGWRDQARIAPPRMVVFRQGDGIGVPLVDETGAPLQIGLTVEKFPNTKQSLKEGIDSLLNGAKRNPQLELVNHAIEDLTLSDDTPAILLTTEFIKEGHRRSLQMKLLTKDQDNTGWITSAFLVSGKDSQWPTKDGALARWLRAHVTSFVLAPDKLDETKLAAVYEQPGKAGE